MRGSKSTGQGSLAILSINPKILCYQDSGRSIR